MASQLPLILVTNDDGIGSPGLLAAAQAIADLGELLIVAPAEQQTGMGRSSPPVVNGAVAKTSFWIGGREVAAYAVPGSPAQAVMYAVLVLSRGRRPHLAVSGINYGENLGASTTASGTVGAALEAAAYRIPALAVSLETSKAYHYDATGQVDWRAAAQVERYFAQVLLARRMPPDVDVLKIDVPAAATTGTRWRLARQSRLPYYESFPIGQSSLPGLDQFDYRVRVDARDIERDSDVWVFHQDGMIAVTPLSCDLTSRIELPLLDALLRGTAGG